MFNKLKKAAVDAAEKATGVDIDGDGTIGGEAGGAGAATKGGKTAALAGLVSSFSMTPEKAAKLDDGHKIPVSKCNGNKKSVLIGINYFNSSAALGGCINDVKNVKKMITTKFNFPSDPAHMRILTDDQTGANLPTRANIIAAMKWLIEGAKEGDSLFFHYSGHGGTQQDTGGDEEDGTDETLIPVDYTTKGVIVDDEIHEILVAPLPVGVRLTAVMDCCHSGSIFDLPYTYKVDGSLDIIEVDNRKAAIKAAMKAGKALVDGDKMSAATHGASAMLALLRKQPEEKRPVVIRKSVADVIQFSGCRDEQTSADATIEGARSGAMSWSLIATLNEFGLDLTYTELLGHIREKLQTKYTQVPQMSTGHKMKMDTTKFMM